MKRYGPRIDLVRAIALLIVMSPVLAAYAIHNRSMDGLGIALIGLLVNILICLNILFLVSHFLSLW